MVKPFVHINNIVSRDPVNDMVIDIIKHYPILESSMCWIPQSARGEKDEWTWSGGKVRRQIHA